MDCDESRSCIVAKATEPNPSKKIRRKLSKSYTGKPSLYKYKCKSVKSFKNPSETSLRKYCLPGEKPLAAKNYRKDCLLLSLKQYLKQMRTLRHKHQKLISYQNEYKIRSTELKRRLHVEYQPDVIDCFTDVDEHFYNIVNGRLVSHARLNFKSLSFIYNYTLCKNVEIGYRKDSILNINNDHKREQERYDLSVLRCVEQAKNLDEFILEDYQKSIALLAKWDQLKYQVTEKDIERQNLAAQIFTITSKLVGLDYMCNMQQKYGRFLYYLSPPIWRGQNREFALSVEIEAKGFDYDVRDDGDNFSILFEKLKMECTSLAKPVLYFVHSSDLIRVFEMVEMQQHYHLSHVLRVSHYTKSIIKAVTTLKDLIAYESTLVANTIKCLESKIKYCTERSNQLKDKFLKILYGWFYKTVGTAEVLKLNLHLEFCYEKICNEKPINMDIFGLAKMLEDTYMDYTFKLEGLSGQNVKQAVIACVKEEKLKEKRSRDAAKELRLFERLEHELNLAFKPWPGEKNAYLPPVKETVINKKNKFAQSKFIVRKKSITESEMEYLRLFTDWTEGEDPGLYLLGSNQI